ncbi:hypothetical protein [Rhizobium terrae]|uniref:hypothetical protein n=1 Tax=Rhizobium terrae TaxID=2171756 RepID=UPI0013C34546|nr:hypothetical protein [Rhizobium terrae]
MVRKLNHKDFSSVVRQINIATPEQSPSKPVVEEHKKVDFTKILPAEKIYEIFNGLNYYQDTVVPWIQSLRRTSRRLNGVGADVLERAYRQTALNVYNAVRSASDPFPTEKLTGTESGLSARDVVNKVAPMSKMLPEEVEAKFVEDIIAIPDNLTKANALDAYMAYGDRIRPAPRSAMIDESIRMLNAEITGRRESFAQVYVETAVGRSINYRNDDQQDKVNTFKKNRPDRTSTISYYEFLPQHGVRPQGQPGRKILDFLKTEPEAAHNYVKYHPHEVEFYAKGLAQLYDNLCKSQNARAELRNDRHDNDYSR